MRTRQTRYGTFAACVAMLCLALQASAGPLGYASETRAYNLAHGRVVFTENCLRCHGSGRRGAPVVGDSEDWKGRISQPLDTLIRHAIEGHGRMPPRGDRDISDQEVAAAVAYVVDRARAIAADDGQSADLPTAGASLRPAGDDYDQVVVQMFLMLIGKDRWK